MYQWLIFAHVLGVFGFLLAHGTAAGIIGNWWSQSWIWATLGLFILIGVTMTFLGSRPLNRTRQLVHAGGSPIALMDGIIKAIGLRLVRSRLAFTSPCRRGMGFLTILDLG